MSSKSKTKGKSWERDVCLFLSELYNQSFIRVPGSGAFIGGSNQFRKETLSDEQIKLSRGDIIPPEHYPYFLAECKNYADFPFHQLILRNDIALLNSWIDQVEHDVTSEKDIWLLFIMAPYIFLNRDDNHFISLFETTKMVGNAEKNIVDNWSV